tara:strand:- start:1376 stop:1633 length:258 start_codon:yes stop_codon:yes gene_type:complete
MNKHQAIYAVAPTTVTIRGDEAFDADGNPVSYDEAAVQTCIDANAYKDQRAAAYPSITDQLDTIYHSGIDAWKATITAVKEEFPK